MVSLEITAKQIGTNVGLVHAKTAPLALTKSPTSIAPVPLVLVASCILNSFKICDLKDSACFLGLQIDEKLDWKIRQKIEKKIVKGNYLLWRHGKKMNIKLKKVVYESFICCHILYCITIWYGAKQSTLKPLNRVLHKAWSKIGGKNISMIILASPGAMFLCSYFQIIFDSCIANSPISRAKISLT
jgi:hypothetical protein